MEINLSGNYSPLNKSITTGKKISQEVNISTRDVVEVGKNIGDEHFDTCRKVFGTVGTAVGVAAGRTAVPIASAVGLGAAGGSFFGPPGTVIGACLGLGVGIYGEVKSRIGRFVGGLLGGAIGTAVGSVASKIPGYNPSEKLANETKGFSFKSLFKKLWDPTYTSHKTISSEEAKEVIKGLKPGDLIITNHDGDFKFELTQKLLGKTGNWTHIGIVGNEKEDGNNVLEVLIATNGPAKTNPEEEFTRNHHVIILKPDYKNPESVENTLKSARDYFGKATYDFKFNLDSDDKLYCQEYIYKAFQKGSPEISIKPSSFLGKKYLSADDFIDSPDVKPVYSTGSNFWVNWLSKFD